MSDCKFGYDCETCVKDKCTRYRTCQQDREDERNNIGIFLRRRNLYALEKDYEKWLKEKNNG